MSLKIKRIELSNFRLHSHVVFEPEDGKTIIAITGPNGSGKSSIVNSVEWALYGTRPKGVGKNANLVKKGIDLKKNDCFVKVDFQMGEYIYRVTRSIITTAKTEATLWRTKASEGDSYKGEIEFSEPIADGVTGVTKEVTKVLQMDDKGFMTAVKVAQKDVDAIILAGKAERGKVIEDLTGISSLTVAVKKAKDEHKKLKETSDLFVADREEMEALEKEVEEEKKSLKKDHAEITKLADKAKEQKQIHLDLKKDLEFEQSIVEQTRDCTKKIEEIQTRISIGEETISEIIEKRSEKKKYLMSLGAAPINLEDIEKKMRETRRELESIVSKKAGFEARKKTLSDMKESLKIEMEEKGFDSEEMVDDNIESISSTIDNLKEEITSTQEEIASIISEGKKINVAIDALTQDNGKCPTCLQTVSDPSEAVSILKEQVASLRSKNSNKKKELAESQKKMSDLQASLEEIKEAKKRIVSCEKESKDLPGIEKSLEESFLQEQILKSRVKTYEEEIEEARLVKGHKDEYDEIVKRYNSANERLEKLKTELEQTKTELGNAKPLTDAKIATLRRKSDKATEEYTEASNRFSEKRADYKISENELVFKTKNLDEMKKSVERYEKTLSAVEKSVASMKVVEEYREDRIAESLPLIEAHASELLNRFTSGRFINVSLDQSFNVTVADSKGEQFPVSTLSGGELSATAIAVRLAIAIVLDTSLLILDEALVSQDLERSEKILHAISDYFHGQIILIAHSSIVHDISDQIIELEGVS